MAGKVDILSMLSKLDSDTIGKVITADSACSDPLFTVSDIAKAENELAKIVRYWFVTNNIGQSKFNELHRRYSQEHGIRSSDADRDRGNMRKSLLKEKITWDFLVSHLMPVLGLTLDHINLSFINSKTGEVVPISSLDANAKVSEQFPDDRPDIKAIILKARDHQGNKVTLASPTTEKD